MPPRHRQPPIRIDPIRLGRLIKQRKAAGLVITLLLILAIMLLDHWAGVLPVNDDWHRYHGQSFDVLRVIDGDTLELAAPDGEKTTTRVRLWGVDTPEMHTNDPNTPPDPFAEQATDFARQNLQGQRVTLHLQEHRFRGGYGRLLAYIELPDGRDLSAMLIKNGLSEHDDRWGHDRNLAYEALERQARENRRGLWGPGNP